MFAFIGGLGWPEILVILGLAIVLGILAAALPARRAARLDILEAIASE